MQLATCPVCRTVTQSDSVKCFRCGSPLDPGSPGANVIPSAQSAIGRDRRLGSLAVNIMNASGNRRRPSLVRVAGWILFVQGILTGLLWWRLTKAVELVTPTDLAIANSIATKIAIWGSISLVAGFLVLRMSRIGWFLGATSMAVGCAVNLHRIVAGDGGSPLLLLIDSFVLLALAINTSAFARKIEDERVSEPKISPTDGPKETTST